jgi:hypothetical protein
MESVGFRQIDERAIQSCGNVGVGFRLVVKVKDETCFQNI